MKKKLKPGVAALTVCVFLGLSTGVKAEEPPTQETSSTVEEDEETLEEKMEENKRFFKLDMKYKMFQIGFKSSSEYSWDEGETDYSIEPQVYFNSFYGLDKTLGKSKRFPLTWYGREYLNFNILGPGYEDVDALLSSTTETGLLVAKFGDVYVKPYYRLNLNADIMGIPGYNLVYNYLGMSIENPKQRWQLGVQGLNSLYTGLNLDEEEYGDLESHREACNYTELQSFFYISHKWKSKKIKSPKPEMFPLQLFGKESLHLVYYGPRSHADDVLSSSGSGEVGIVLAKFGDIYLKPSYKLKLKADTLGGDGMTNSLKIKLEDRKRNWKVELIGSNEYRNDNKVELKFSMWYNL